MQAVTRIQVLVLGNKSYSYRLLLHLFRILQHPSVLADPCHVLHHIVLHHDEATNQGRLPRVESKKYHESKWNAMFFFSI